MEPARAPIEDVPAIDPDAVEFAGQWTSWAQLARTKAELQGHIRTPRAPGAPDQPRMRRQVARDLPRTTPPKDSQSAFRALFAADHTEGETA